MIVANIILIMKVRTRGFFSLRESDGRDPREGREIQASYTRWAGDEVYVRIKHVVDDEKRGGTIATGAERVECCSDVRRRGVDRFDSIDEGSSVSSGAHICCRVRFVDDDL